MSDRDLFSNLQNATTRMCEKSHEACDGNLNSFSKNDFLIHDQSKRERCSLLSTLVVQRLFFDGHWSIERDFVLDCPISARFFKESLKDVRSAYFASVFELIASNCDVQEELWKKLSLCSVRGRLAFTAADVIKMDPGLSQYVRHHYAGYEIFSNGQWQLLRRTDSTNFDERLDYIRREVGLLDNVSSETKENERGKNEKDKEKDEDFESLCKDEKSKSEPEVSSKKESMDSGKGQVQTAMISEEPELMHFSYAKRPYRSRVIQDCLPGPKAIFRRRIIGLDRLYAESCKLASVEDVLSSQPADIPTLRTLARRAFVQMSNTNISDSKQPSKRFFSSSALGLDMSEDFRNAFPVGRYLRFLFRFAFSFSSFFSCLTIKKMIATLRRANYFKLSWHNLNSVLILRYQHRKTGAVVLVRGAGVSSLLCSFEELFFGWQRFANLKRVLPLRDFSFKRKLIDHAFKFFVRQVANLKRVPPLSDLSFKWRLIDRSFDLVEQVIDPPRVRPFNDYSFVRCDLGDRQVYVVYRFQFHRVISITSRPAPPRNLLVYGSQMGVLLGQCKIALIVVWGYGLTEAQHCFLRYQFPCIPIDVYFGNDPFAVHVYGAQADVLGFIQDERA